MTELHPLTFARTVSMRLSGIQNRLDQLEDLLPLSELSADARRELRDLQERLLDLILDTRHTERSFIHSLERQFPDYVARSRGLWDLGERSSRLIRQMEGCPHRCWPVRVVQMENGVEVDAYEPIPKCLAEEFSERHPGHFKIYPFPKPADDEAPDLPGFEA